MKQEGTFRVKAGLAEMLKGGVIMDVVTADQARVAEAAGACAVMALERVPADIRRASGLATSTASCRSRSALTTSRSRRSTSEAGESTASR